MLRLTPKTLVIKKSVMKKHQTFQNRKDGEKHY